MVAWRHYLGLLLCLSQARGPGIHEACGSTRHADCFCRKAAMTQFLQRVLTSEPLMGDEWGCYVSNAQ